MYDVIVVGGGPSGMMSAIAAREFGSSVLLIEKNQILGSKMKISGGGRCNLSNIATIEKFIENIPGNGRFLFSGLNQFSNQDVISFFENSLHVKTKIEDKGRVFPESDKSKTLIDSLHKYLINNGVNLLFNSQVKKVIVKNNIIDGVMLKDGTSIKGKSVILATGGVSFPKTGSTGDGHRMAESLGHKLTELYPTSVPLISEDLIIKQRILQGVSLRNVEITLYGPNGKKIKTEEGDLIFTHFGLSGPAVLRLSREVYFTKRKFKDLPLKTTIDIFPSKNHDEIVNVIEKFIKNNSKKSFLNGMHGFLPEKLLNGLIFLYREFENKKMSELSKKDILKLVQLVKFLPISIQGTKSIEEAIVTGGGVSIKEVNPKTFESKIIKGLYLVGEMLDVDAYTGGYNMQVAFTTGYVAGKSVRLSKRNL